MSDHASTSNSSSGLSDPSEHTGLPLLARSSSRGGSISGRASLGRVSGGRGLSGLLLVRSRSGSGSSGRSGRTGLTRHYDVVSCFV